MSYKIAVASSDGKVIDLTFGEAESFLIFDVDDKNEFRLSETRKWEESRDDSSVEPSSACGSHDSGCGTGSGCRSGSGSGCGGGAEIPKVALISDVRCLLCKKIGFQARKQLEHKAITAFDIDEDIEGTVRKIAAYFDKVDNHKTLRGIAHDVN